MEKQNKTKLSEAGRQFKEIFEAYNSPIEYYKMRIAKLRKKRVEDIIKDLGI